MATLKEFEDALRQQGMVNALAILEGLKKRDREKRSIAPARRVVGRKMTAELARAILDMHATTGMTQQEIAFKLGVNQGRVNEVIKRGKWLNGNPAAPEARSRDAAMGRLAQRAEARRTVSPVVRSPAIGQEQARTPKPANIPAKPSPHGGLAAGADELPFGRSRAPDRDVAGGPVKGLLRRPVEAASTIVSAQLAFLDL